MLQSKQKRKAFILYVAPHLIEYFLPSCAQGGKMPLLTMESFSCLCTLRKEKVTCFLPNGALMPLSAHMACPRKCQIIPL